MEIPKPIAFQYFFLVHFCRIQKIYIYNFLNTKYTPPQFSANINAYI